MDIKRLDFLIDNKWISTSEDRYFSVYRPWDRSIIALAAQACEADVNAAALAARKAAAFWSGVPVQERCEFLLRAAALLRSRAQELAEAETEETGKPIYESLHIDIPLVIRAFEYYGKTSPAVLDHTYKINIEDSHFADYMSYEPYGVTGIIAPWNFPLHLLTRDLCPALAAGNTVVVKPSSKTPVTAALLGEILLDAGLPKGVVNIIYGSGDTTGNQLVKNENIDLVAFTGSEEVGRAILRASSESSIIKKLILELGGKGAICVNWDADLEGAANSAVYGVCMNQGEVCCASSRCYVHEAVYDSFLKKVLRKMQSLVIGDPSDSVTDLGSLIDEEQLNKVDRYVKNAVSQGASILTGGKRYVNGVCALGSFYEPTVLVGVTEEMECMQKEIFGPVLMVVKVKNLDEAIARANHSRFGLGAAVWSEDPAILERSSHALQAGTVWQNHNLTSTLEAPYGGIKNSGFGRQYGPQGLLEYVYIKNNMRYLGPPYADFYHTKRNP